MVDKTDDILQRAIHRIRTNISKYRKFSSNQELEANTRKILKNIRLSTSVEESVRDADLVIEAIVEDMDEKRSLYEKVERYSRSTTIIATNTSSLTLKNLSKNMKRKHNFGGLHFFIPVSKMKLLEVVSMENTSPQTLKTLLEFGKRIEKVTVHCKDTPGFIVNRMLIVSQSEALGLVDRGISSAENVDLAYTAGLGQPIGPFALLDFIGLDTALNIQKSWLKHYPNEANVKVSPTLEALVAAGKLGRKSGEGFYKYKSKI